MNSSIAGKEAIGICIALEGIDDIVNHALLNLIDVSAYPGEAEVRYKSHVHQEIFLVRLLDFVNEGGESSLTGIKGSCLDVLIAACDSKAFDSGGSVSALRDAVDALSSWLNAETTFRMWLPTLEIDATLTVSRMEFLFILGNHVKHNLSRLTGVSKRVVMLLERNGYSVKLEQVPLALDDFREHLQEDYFVYYGTWLTELLNNVRWGLQDYLHASFQRAYTKITGEDLRYTYNFPDSITDPVSRVWFWRLMNNLRREPYLKRFTGARYMKKEVLRQ
jgi:hypothetical protein